MSQKWNRSDYLASWPKFLPFPYAIRRGRRPVPNQQSVDWPQAQFAPQYLPPGSASFQPYSYLKNDVPLTSQEPAYNTVNYGPYRRSGVGPGGDVARLPAGYGADMTVFPAGVHLKTELPSGEDASVGLAKARLQKLAHIIRTIRSRRPTRKNRRQLNMAIKTYRAIRVELGLPVKQSKVPAKARRVHAFQQAKKQAVSRWVESKKAQYAQAQAAAVAAAGHLPAPSLAVPTQTTFWGLKATSVAIPAGVPSTVAAGPPPSDLTPAPKSSATGLLGFGDGFAWELAPLQASAPYTEYGDLALENGGDCGCGCGGAGNCAKTNGFFTDEEGNVSWGTVALVAAAVGGLYWFYTAESVSTVRPAHGF
jgi:hypothetical protein